MQFLPVVRLEPATSRRFQNVKRKFGNWVKGCTDGPLGPQVRASAFYFFICYFFFKYVHTHTERERERERERWWFTQSVKLINRLNCLRYIFSRIRQKIKQLAVAEPTASPTPGTPSVPPASHRIRKMEDMNYSVISFVVWSLTHTHIRAHTEINLYWKKNGLQQKEIHTPTSKWGKSVLASTLSNPRIPRTPL